MFKFFTIWNWTQLSKELLSIFSACLVFVMLFQTQCWSGGNVFLIRLVQSIQAEYASVAGFSYQLSLLPSLQTCFVRNVSRKVLGFDWYQIWLTDLTDISDMKMPSHAFLFANAVPNIVIPPGHNKKIKKRLQKIYRLDGVENTFLKKKTPI